MRALRLALTALILSPLLESCPAAPGDGGGSTPSPGIAQDRRLERSPGPADAIATRDTPQGIQIDGVVRTRSGDPIPGVLVKLFSNGIVIANVRTESDGGYSINGNPPLGGNNTSVLWFQSPDPERLLDASAVLSAGNVAREKKLFPPCVQHIKILGNVSRLEVDLMTEAELKASLTSSGCLEQSS